MRGNFQKGIIILVIASIIGVLFQFSIDDRPESEQKFVFKPSPPPFIKDSSIWADSILHSLKLEESIGQLFMIAAYPNNGKNDIRRVTALIRKHKIGGIIFFHGQPEEIARLAQYYQSISEVPLLIAVDGEWGPSMRMEKTLVYPRQMMLGAINDNDILYQMGSDIGKQLRMLGIHVNFAPVIDVNNNPKNPVIGSRSFGESRENVARKGILYMRGMQDERIIAVAKHFPGHGDTDKDSHHELPLIPHNLERLDSIELFPFKALIGSGVSGIMMAHLNIPDLDTARNQPSTLSIKIADSLLKQDLKFKGLVFTDAMTMEGVAAHYDPSAANIQAILAGNDIVLMPDDLDKTIDELKHMARDSSSFEKELNRRCLKILQAKEWAVKPFLNDRKLSDQALIDSLNHPLFELHRQKLIEKSMTLAKNSEDLLPIKNLTGKNIAAVSIGEESTTEFQRSISLYKEADLFNVAETIDSISLSALMDSLENYYNTIIIGIHSNSFSTSKNYGFTDRFINITNSLLSLPNVIISSFASPYLLSQFKNLDNTEAILLAYENDEISQSKAAQVIFGAIAADGHLPVRINKQYPAGKGIAIKSLDRLSYTLPIEVGLDIGKFYKIDSIVNDAIEKKATPGCQIVIARHGKIVLNKAYGYHTYYKKQEVIESDLYDIASLTKVMATVPTLMQLEQEGKIDISKPLANYLPELDTTNKSKIRIDDILLHQAGLTSWIPFYQAYLEPIYPNQKFASSKYSKQYPIRIGKHFYVNKHLKYTPKSFSRTPDSLFTNQVAEGLYMNPALIDSIYLSIYASELGKKKYRYSDLGFYLFYQLAERLTGQYFDDYVDSIFYQSLGASTLTYKPLDKFPLERILPTENDLVLRRQVVHGYVHDPGAAMLGGVSGHAGLFSNANDLAKMMQMLLNKGSYGGKKYIDPDIVEKYTSCVECRNGNRRGLGFDKPEPDTTKNGPAFEGISLESFGHTGFTGTMAWADPATGIVYIFLSNRVYPDAVSNKLAEMDVRTNIQQVIYQAIID